MHSREAQPEHRPDPCLQHKACPLVCAGMPLHAQASLASLEMQPVAWWTGAGIEAAHLSTPSCWKMPMQTPMRSERLGAQ